MRLITPQVLRLEFHTFAFDHRDQSCRSFAAASPMMYSLPGLEFANMLHMPTHQCIIWIPQTKILSVTFLLIPFNSSVDVILRHQVKVLKSLSNFQKQPGIRNKATIDCKILCLQASQNFRSKDPGAACV